MEVRNNRKIIFAKKYNLFLKGNHLFILYLQSDYYNSFVYISVSSSRFSPAGEVIVDGAHQNANGVTESFLKQDQK